MVTDTFVLCNISAAYCTDHINESSCSLSGLAPAKGLELLIASLEPSMSKLGSCVDEFELDLLKGRPLGAGEQSMSESDHTLLGSWNSSLHMQAKQLKQKRVKRSLNSAGTICTQLINFIVLNSND